ncbi:hypothetical protein [Chlorobium limicola]
MAPQTFIQKCYASYDRQVSWVGVQLNDGDDFAQLLMTEVADRVHDAEGSSEFEAHLRSLATTGFEQKSLQALLEATPREERDWAIGEALAEVHLTHEHGINWPWNSERDKRTPLASLPGADLVGLMSDEDGSILVIGEVKCSSEAKNPPQVMYGRSGMTNQLDKLAEDLGLVNTLLRWLFPRCKSTALEPDFNYAMKRLLQSGNRAIALFGILIRDTTPNTQDLCSRGRHLANRLHAPTSCHLKALHLPCPINQLPARIKGGES